MKSKKQREDERIKSEAIGKIADLLLDLVKLIFAGVLIAGMMDMALDKTAMMLTASALIVAMLVIWYFIFKRSKRRS